MVNLIHLAQFIVAISVLWVWIVRYKVVIAEFEKFNLSEQTRIKVAAVKVSFAITMFTSVWITEMKEISALGMMIMMIGAQYYHNRYDSPISKRLPSLVLLLLCILMLV